MKNRGLIVHPGGGITEQELGFGDIALAVGGYVQVLYGAYSGSEHVVSVCMNEEGLIKQMEPNPYASSAIHFMQDYDRSLKLVGPVVFMGTRMFDGGVDFCDLDDESGAIIRTAVRKTINKEKKQ